MLQVWSISYRISMTSSLLYQLYQAILFWIRLSLYSDWHGVWAVFIIIIFIIVIVSVVVLIIIIITIVVVPIIIIVIILIIIIIIIIIIIVSLLLLLLLLLLSSLLLLSLSSSLLLLLLLSLLLIFHTNATQPVQVISPLMPWRQEPLLVHGDMGLCKHGLTHWDPRSTGLAS